MEKGTRYKPYASKVQLRNTKRWVGWRYAALITGFVGAIGSTFYLVAIDPMLHPEKWQEIQRVARAGIKQEDIQPGNMKVWTDPFDRTELPKDKRWFW